MNFLFLRTVSAVLLFVNVIECSRGRCPIIDFDLYSVTVKQCYSDRDCGRNFICCPTMQNKNICVQRHPDTNTYGLPTIDDGCPRLPYPEPVCVRKNPELCANDGDCYGSSKCCPIICDGTECTPETTPTIDEDPSCPNVDNLEILCLQRRPALCTSNSDCDYGNVCCRTVCGGSQCVPRPGTNTQGCPRLPDPEPVCFRKGDELCQTDANCYEPLKCCPTICQGTECAIDTTPTVNEDPTCPNVYNLEIFCTKPNPTLCYSNQNCDIGLVCCRTVCGGSQCTPQPGTPSTRPNNPGCPRLPSLATILCPAVLPTYECQNNYDCRRPGYQSRVCCLLECGGTKCQDPIITYQ